MSIEKVTFFMNSWVAESSNPWSEGPMNQRFAPGGRAGRAPAAGSRSDRQTRSPGRSSAEPYATAEWRPTMLPSVSVMSETKPWSPIENFGRTTEPPAAVALASSTAQSSQEK